MRSTTQNDVRLTIEKMLNKVETNMLNEGVEISYTSSQECNIINDFNLLKSKYEKVFIKGRKHKSIFIEC